MPDVPCTCALYNVCNVSECEWSLERTRMGLQSFQRQLLTACGLGLEGADGGEPRTPHP